MKSMDDSPHLQPGTDRDQQNQSPSFIVQITARYLQVTCSTLLLLGLVDTALVMVRSPESAQLALGYLGLSWGGGTWVGLTLAAYCAGVEIVTSLVLGAEKAKRLLDGWLRTVLISGSSAIVAIVLLRPWFELITWPYWVSPLAAAAAGGAFFILRKRLSRPRVAGLLALGAVALFVIDATVYRRLYLSLHQLVFFATIILLGAALFRLKIENRMLRWAPLLLACGSQLALFSFGPAYGSLAVSHGTTTPKILSLVHLTADGDGDGYAAIFGGGDCNDSDASIRPGTCEGANEDRNCNGHAGLTQLIVPAPSTRRSKSPLPDVYLFVIDTVRADFGQSTRKAVAPEIDQFASTALDFQAAYSPYPSTVQAMLSMVQSRYYRNTLRQHPSGLEVLSQHGYDARIWINQARHRIENGTSILRISRDPVRIFQRAEDKTADTARIVDEAIAESQEQTGPPRFRWLHSLDPHAPVGAEGATRIERYRNAIGGVSRQFGRLIHALDQTERGRAAIVILLADHGEEFFDHGALYHATTVYEESIRVPLLMRVPGVEPRRIRSVTSLIDVWPTLFDALGLPAQPTWQGQSQLRAESAPRWIFSQVRPPSDVSGLWRPDYHAVIGPRYKLIHDLKRNLVQVFDLREDPHERRNLAGQRPSIEQQLAQKLARFQDDATCRVK